VWRRSKKIRRESLVLYIIHFYLGKLKKFHFPESWMFSLAGGLAAASFAVEEVLSGSLKSNILNN
jgi:hypothetical protein